MFVCERVSVPASEQVIYFKRVVRGWASELLGRILGPAGYLGREQVRFRAEVLKRELEV